MLGEEDRGVEDTDVTEKADYIDVARVNVGKMGTENSDSLHFRFLPSVVLSLPI